MLLALPRLLQVLLAPVEVAAVEQVILVLLAPQVPIPLSQAQQVEQDLLGLQVMLQILVQQAALALQDSQVLLAPRPIQALQVLQVLSHLQHLQKTSLLQ